MNHIIKRIVRLKDSIKLNVSPIITNEALIESFSNNGEKFEDTIDLIIIDNFNIILYENISTNSLDDIDISKLKIGDKITIESVECDVNVIFDGFVTLKAPRLGKIPSFNFDKYNEDNIPF